MDPRLKEKVEKLVEEYKPEGAEDSGVKMKILLKDNIPVFQNPWRLSPGKRAMTNKIIESWIGEEIAKESISEYVSPVVLAER